MDSGILKIALGVFIGNLITALFALLLAAIGLLSGAGIGREQPEIQPIEVDVGGSEIPIPKVDNQPRR